jgi:hypothetical protein
LIRREVLARIGGLEVINATLIDDVALAKAAKKIDGIFLGHSGLARSIRPYPAIRGYLAHDHPYRLYAVALLARAALRDVARD